MIEFVAYFRPLCVCGFFINVHKVVCSSSDFPSAPCLFDIRGIPYNACSIHFSDGVHIYTQIVSITPGASFQKAKAIEFVPPL